MLDIDISFTNKCYICACGRLSEVHKKVSHVATTSELFKVQNTVNQYQVQMKRLENWFEYKYLGI